MKKIYKEVKLDIILLKQEDVLIGSGDGFGIDDNFTNNPVKDNF